MKIDWKVVFMPKSSTIVFFKIFPKKRENKYIYKILNSHKINYEEYLVTSQVFQNYKKLIKVFFE